jgi:hypothetical protein
MRYEPERPNESRRLVLDDDPRLGEAVGPDEFRMHWEFWLQVSMIFETCHQRPLTDPVSGTDALALAEMLRTKTGEESWQIHLHLWGDDDRHALGECIEFLAGGSFFVLRP